jgi:ketosteroid isomerase-like protein
MSTKILFTPFDMVQDVYGAFRVRDTTRFFQHFAENIEILQSPDLPWGGCYRGHDEVREFLAALTGHISSSVTIERMIDSGDRVVVTGQTRGTVKSNDAAFDVPFAHVWTVRGGCIVRAEFYIDHRVMLPALEAEQRVTEGPEGETLAGLVNDPEVENVSASAA